MIKNTQYRSKIGWNPEEQNFIEECVQIRQIKSWRIISSLLNSFVPHKNKTSKQCRQRYINHIRPKSKGQFSIEWTNDQIYMLFQKFDQIGPRWALIAKFIPRKSQNCVKNKFYGMIRKLLRKLQATQKQNDCKRLKMLKESFILRLISKNSDLHFYQTAQRIENSSKLVYINELKTELMTLFKLNKIPEAKKELISILLKINQIRTCNKQKSEQGNSKSEVELVQSRESATKSQKMQSKQLNFGSERKEKIQLEDVFCQIGKQIFSINQDKLSNQMQLKQIISKEEQLSINSLFQNLINDEHQHNLFQFT